MVNCKMVNVPNTQFCASCHRPLSTVSYDAIARDAEKTKKRFERLEKTMKKCVFGSRWPVRYS